MPFLTFSAFPGRPGLPPASKLCQTSRLWSKLHLTQITKWKIFRLTEGPVPSALLTLLHLPTPNTPGLRAHLLLATWLPWYSSYKPAHSHSGPLYTLFLLPRNAPHPTSAHSTLQDLGLLDALYLCQMARTAVWHRRIYLDIHKRSDHTLSTAVPLHCPTFLYFSLKCC